MSALREVDLSEAGNVFAISNTPMFLLKKIKEMPVSKDLSRGFSGDEILSDLSAAMTTRAETLQDAVRPYVYLVALWMKDNPRWLRAVGAMDLPAANDWFRFAHQVLMETYLPTNAKTFVIKAIPSAPTILVSSSAASSRPVIEVGKP